jgi:hypothetical protein
MFVMHWLSRFGITQQMGFVTVKHKQAGRQTAIVAVKILYLASL